MRKILFLAIFIPVSLTVLFADEVTETVKITRPGLIKPLPLGSAVNAQSIHDQVAETESKSFNIGYHGIIKIMPMGSVLNVQIIYDQVTEAPQPVQENLAYNLATGHTRKITYRFNVKLFDRDGYLVC